MDMTTLELSDFFGKSADTIQRTARKCGIAMAKGKKKRYSKDEVELIACSLYTKVPLAVRGAIDEAYAKQVSKPAANAEVITRADLAVFGAAIVSEMMKQFLPMIQNQPKQIEFVQDYYSIKGYASKLGQQIAFSDALALGRLAGKLSREQGKEIRKVDDEAFGRVNSYHVDILKEVFQI